jgi:uncharacterized protein YqgV (UPF0045/DUF77 family)
MIAEFSVHLPNVEHMSPHLARILSVLDGYKIEYSLGAMSTSIRGDAGTVFTVLKKCHDILKSESDELVMNVTIVDRRHERHSLADSIHCVENLRQAKKFSA